VPSAASRSQIATRGSPSPSKNPGAGSAGSPEPASKSGPGIERGAPTASASAPWPAGPTPFPQSGGSLNDRLKGLNGAGPVDYTPKRVKVTDPNDQRDRIVAAYEASLAPPPEILAQAFGLIRMSRTAAHADSISYVFERGTFLGLPICKAYKITEHPYTRPAVDLSRNPLGDTGRQIAKADIEIVNIYPCDESKYVPVKPGSLTTPVPRHAADGPLPGQTPVLAPKR